MKLKNISLLATLALASTSLGAADKPVLNAKMKAAIDQMIVVSFPAGENQDLSRLKQDVTYPDLQYLPRQRPGKTGRRDHR